MPYAPTERNRVDEYTFRGITGAANMLSEAGMKALTRYQEEKSKKEYLDGQFETLRNNETFSSYIPHEALARWNSINADKKAGYLKGIEQSFAGDMQKQLQTAHADYYGRAGGGRAGGEPPSLITAIDPATGQPLQGQAMNSKTGQMVDTSGSKSGDNWQKLDKDVHALTGVGLGDWTNASKKRLSDDGQFLMGEVPGKADVFGKVQPSKTIKLPVSQYQQFIDRYNNMSGSGTAAPGPLTPDAVEPDLPAAPAASATQKVRVKSPDGKIGFIPAAQLPAALAAGYQQIQ